LISRDTQTAVDLSPLLQNQNSADLDGRHEEMWKKGVIGAFTSIVKYILVVDSEKENSAISTFFDSWTTTLHHQAR
jgi:hypothetical protein